VEDVSTGISSTVGVGASAAVLLSDACRLDLESRDSLQLEVVRDLAEDLKDHFDSLAQTGTKDAGTADLLAEAALRCADLANLAACNLPELSETAAPQAAAAIHLSTGAARALSLLAESEAKDLENTHSDNVLRDARGARWRTDLATRQVDEFMRDSSRS
jgi:hypothetical protein